MDGKRILIILAVLSMSFIFTPHAHAEFKGKVVDAVTGKPIEGAVVLMYWRRECLPYGTREFFDAEETLADHSGMFEIKGHKVNWNPLCRIDTPQFYIYRAGYKAIDLAWFIPAFKTDRIKKHLFFEGDLVVFKLHKPRTKKERQWALSTQGTFPHKYQRLLIRETNKERKALNLPLKKEVDDVSK